MAYPLIGATQCPCASCTTPNNGAEDSASCCTDLTSVTQNTDAASYNYATRDDYVDAYLRQISFDLLDETASQKVANYGHCDYGFTIVEYAPPP